MGIERGAGEGGAERPPHERAGELLHRAKAFAAQQGVTRALAVLLNSEDELVGRLVNQADELSEQGIAEVQKRYQNLIDYWDDWSEERFPEARLTPENISTRTQQLFVVTVALELITDAGEPPIDPSA